MILSVVFRYSITRRGFKIAVPLSLCSVFGMRSLFASIDLLTEGGLSGIAYPIAIGGSIIGFATYAHFIIKDRLSVIRFIGIILAVVGIGLLAIV